MAFGGEHGGSTNFAEGKRLFELGNEAASNYKHSEALEYYAQSIAACPTPVPHINRARIFVQRIRYVEALAELEEANRLDIARGNEFAALIGNELNWVQTVLRSHISSDPDELICVQEREEHRKTAESILCTAFEIPELAWEYRSLGDKRDLVEYHLFNELNNIAIFDDISLYPEVKELYGMYGEQFIHNKVNKCPDVSAYKSALFKLHSYLCAFELDSMILIRRYMHYDIHQCLLTMDYGDMFDSLSSDCNGRICEANEFYEQS